MRIRDLAALKCIWPVVRSRCSFGDSETPRGSDQNRPTRRDAPGAIGSVGTALGVLERPLVAEAIDWNRSGFTARC